MAIHKTHKIVFRCTEAMMLSMENIAEGCGQGLAEHMRDICSSAMAANPAYTVKPAKCYEDVTYYGHEEDDPTGTY